MLENAEPFLLGEGRCPQWIAGHIALRGFPGVSEDDMPRKNMRASGLPFVPITIAPGDATHRVGARKSRQLAAGERERDAFCGSLALLSPALRGTGAHKEFLGIARGSLVGPGTSDCLGAATMTIGKPCYALVTTLLV
jgi:hypothetical protein